MRQRGFTLLEIIVAFAIFAFIAVAALSSLADTGYLAGKAQRARLLRLLADGKMGEILAFERHFDDVIDGDFHEQSKMLGEDAANWKWQLDVRDVVVFGISTQDSAEYLFGVPTDEEKADAAAPQQGQPSQSAKKGETQQLRELTLKVTAPADDGVGDSVEILTFMPLVDKRTGGN